ncbi:hypothetical protein CCR97_20315, partial [Rhodoplanes elegans]|nr:hypothetical protein [Rhodoplanes elegans]
MKTQGRLRLEDSQIETADRLLKLAAVATKAAAVTLALLQARDGIGCRAGRHRVHGPRARRARRPRCRLSRQDRTAEKLAPTPQSRLGRWIIARLGGWDGYPS